MFVFVLIFVLLWQDAEGGCVDGDHDADEVDLTGLMESVVDSDEEEDLAESIDVSLILQVFLPSSGGWIQRVPPGGL